SARAMGRNAAKPQVRGEVDIGTVHIYFKSCLVYYHCWTQVVVRLAKLSPFAPRKNVLSRSERRPCGAFYQWIGYHVGTSRIPPTNLRRLASPCSESLIAELACATDSLDATGCASA